jgi:hypothetical protein
VITRKKNLFFDTAKMNQRCRQLILALEAGEGHANLASTDINDDKLVR